MQDLMKSIQRIDEAIQIYYTKSSDKYAHIDQNDIEKANKILNEKQIWYDQTANRFNTLKPHEDSPILCSQIKQERDVRLSLNLNSTNIISFFRHLKENVGLF